MGLWSVFMEIMRRPSFGDVVVELAIYMLPLWFAVIVGVLVGWSWKPTWAILGRETVDSRVANAKDSDEAAAVPPSIGTLTESSSSIPGFNLPKLQLPSCISWVTYDSFSAYSYNNNLPTPLNSDCCNSQLKEDKSRLVMDDDLEHLWKLVEEQDGGPAWIQMMDRSTPTMGYQAWRRDPPTGPPQYRSRTVFEDATPEMVRDLFWDDEYRKTWDDMLLHANILEECPTSGTMVVHWIRKFPFFCSDREYIIGRRIWESGRCYYCVTKGVPSSAVPRRDKPRRVDLYYSSFCVRAVESRRGDGQLTACEVLFFHHEDMGIPWEIAKLGVRQGMWGAVKKFDPALRIYQKLRASSAPPSRCAFMAQINTKVSADYLKSLEFSEGNSSEVAVQDSSDEKPKAGLNIPRFIVVGAAVALACSFDRGLLTKAIIFGVARRFANIGRRLQ